MVGLTGVLASEMVSMTVPSREMTAVISGVTTTFPVFLKPTSTPSGMSTSVSLTTMLITSPETRSTSVTVISRADVAWRTIPTEPGTFSPGTVSTTTFAV